jgi:protein SCO1/2/putative membrane protein
VSTALLALPGAVLAALVLFVAPPADSKPRQRPVPVAEKDHIADFSLRDRSGQIVTRNDLLGKVWIASFILIPCPEGKCPQVTQTMEDLQELLPNRPDLLLVTFLVRPVDSPGNVDSYAEKFNADPNRWLFLSGSQEDIDRVMRSCYLRGPKSEKGGTDHSQRLVVIDREGKIRGWHDGLKEQYVTEEQFEENLLKLRRKVAGLLAPTSWFPGFNATLNGISAALIFVGWIGIRTRLVRLHITCMLSALAVSAVFLGSYLFYHIVIRAGEVTRFADQAPGAPDWVRYLYSGILISHTILAVVATPLALVSAYLGLRNRLRGHTRIARWTLPIWLYVSVTGVVVYWMLYRLYPLG